MPLPSTGFPAPIPKGAGQVRLSRLLSSLSRFRRTLEGRLQARRLSVRPPSCDHPGKPGQHPRVRSKGINLLPIDASGVGSYCAQEQSEPPTISPSQASHKHMSMSVKTPPHGRNHMKKDPHPGSLCPLSTSTPKEEGDQSALTNQPSDPPRKEDRITPSQASLRGPTTPEPEGPHEVDGVRTNSSTAGITPRRERRDSSASL